MSAAVSERTRQAERTRHGERTRQAARGTASPAVGTATIPAQRAKPAAAPRRADTVRDSARRAYARRDNRLSRLLGNAPARSGAPAGRAQFVLLVMVLLVVGLVATLWLSTAAAADSYRLQDARSEARTLSQQSERLHREVSVLESAPELARRATELGMVPVQDSARLVVGPDGSVTVVGEPGVARAPAPPPAPAPPAPAPEPAAADPEAPEPAPSDQAAGDQAAPVPGPDGTAVPPDAGTVAGEAAAAAPTAGDPAAAGTD